MYDECIYVSGKRRHLKPSIYKHLPPLSTTSLFTLQYFLNRIKIKNICVPETTRVLCQGTSLACSLFRCSRPPLNFYSFIVNPLTSFCILSLQYRAFHLHSRKITLNKLLFIYFTSFCLVCYLLLSKLVIE